VNRGAFSLDECEKKVAEIPKWTFQATTTSDLSILTYGDIGAFHSGCTCVQNAPKYLDKSDDFLFMDPGKSTPDKKLLKVFQPNFLKKGQWRVVNTSYIKALTFWVLCSCTKRYVSFSLLFLLLTLCRKLGLWPHYTHTTHHNTYSHHAHLTHTTHTAQTPHIYHTQHTQYTQYTQNTRHSKHTHHTHTPSTHTTHTHHTHTTHIHTTHTQLTHNFTHTHTLTHTLTHVVRRR